MSKEKLTSSEKLVVLQKAYALSLIIHKLTKAMPKDEQYGGIADQLRRTTKSVCANLTEGFAKRFLSAA